MNVDRLGIAAEGDTKIEGVIGGIERQIGDFTESAELPVEDAPRRKGERDILRPAQETVTVGAANIRRQV
jgi:hypothetical protein